MTEAEESDAVDFSASVFGEMKRTAGFICLH